MPLEKADKDAYKARIETDIKTAREKLEGQIGKEGVDIEEAIKKAKTSIDSSRSGVVSSIESKTEKEGLDEAIDAGEFIKVINDKAKEATDAIETNAETYKKRHEGHVSFAKVRAELLDPKVNSQIWEVENQVKGERGAEKAGDFSVNVTDFSQLQQLERNLRGLRDFCDKARTVRFTVLEPKAEELNRIKTNLGDADPALTKKIDEMLTSINEKVEGFKKAEELYDKKLAEVKSSLASQIQREVAKEQELLQKSGSLQQESADKGGVKAETLTAAHAAWQKQKKFVQSLKDYVTFVGGKKTTGYGEGGGGKAAGSEKVS